MKRNLIYVLSLMLIAGGFCACKRTVSVSEENSKTTVYKDGTVVTKSYSVKPGGNAQEISNPQELSERTAKRLLREKLQKTNSERLVAPVRIGYYECNDFGERMTLLKLAANKIINLKCDEIVTEQGSTYWVTVDLTWRGRWLKESPAKPEFPEDRITEEEAVARLFPVVDQDPWGVPTTDNNVPAEITEAIKAFYRGLQAGRNYNQSMMDADIICAMSLIDKLASYGVNKLDADPFTRGTQLTPELVDHIRVLRMPRLENAYLVSVGEHDFLYVISKDANARVMIEDLAYLAPSELQSIDQTVCSLGGTITKEEIDDAREAKRMSDEWEAKLKELEDKYKQVEAAITEGEDAVICKTSGALRRLSAGDQLPAYKCCF